MASSIGSAGAERGNTLMFTNPAKTVSNIMRFIVTSIKVRESQSAVLLQKADDIRR